MTIRYLLIKHLSLGFGVLLKRENSDIGKIYFAESKATKSVVLSHPSLSVADHLTLTKFVSLGLFEGLFDQATKESAKEYFDTHIKNMHVSENECYGEIMDEHEFSFRISIDQNSFIVLSCTCSSNSACKHLYAVFINMMKLIDPKANISQAVSNIPTNEFKELLERFLYVRNGDNIPVISKLSYLIRSLEKLQLFIDTVLPFYQRGQYKARVISDILAPLYFSNKNKESLDQILESASEEIKAMLIEAENYYLNNLLKEYERKNSETKKANLYHILLANDMNGLVSLLRHAEDNYSEERIASQVMVEYIKYQDLSIEDIIALKSCYLFQVNHRYFMNDLLNSPLKDRLSGYLLFFDELPLDEKKIKQIPLAYFLKVAPFSNDKSHYIQIVHLLYDNLKEEDLPALAELIIGVCLQHEYIDERTIRLTIELSKRIPNGSYINELVDNNIRRPKKARTA